MRKLLLLLIITLASLNVTAQTTHAAYCEVVVHNAALFSQKVSAFVDAGTEKRGYIINEDGSKKIFNSPVDILNFFGKLGWSVSQNYFTPDSKEKDNIFCLSPRGNGQECGNSPHPPDEDEIRIRDITLYSPSR